MKSFLVVASMALCMTLTYALAFNKRSSDSWAGSSNYLLHGLSEDNQTLWINNFVDDGGKVVRLWVSYIDEGCQKGFWVPTAIPNLEPTTIGTFDDTVLEALDKVLAKLVDAGVKAIISVHDGNAFGINSCDVYCEEYADGGSKSNTSADNFYSSTEAKTQYDNRLTHILEYTSPSSGKTWGNWSEAILAFDIENEPFVQAEDQAADNDPNDWLCGRSGVMRGIMGDSSILIATGGVGGDESYGNLFMPKALECTDIDIMSVHGYVSTANFWTSFLSDHLSTVEENGKLLQVEEWGVKTSYTDDFDSQANAINGQKIPWTYWQFTFYDKGDCTGCCSGWDGFEIGFNSSKGDIKTEVEDADSTTAAQDWSAYIS